MISILSWVSIMGEEWKIELCDSVRIETLKGYRYHENENYLKIKYFVLKATCFQKEICLCVCVCVCVCVFIFNVFMYLFIVLKSEVSLLQGQENQKRET